MIWSRRIFIVVVMALGTPAGVLAQSPDSALPLTEFPDSNDVVLMPTEEFSFEFAAYLAKILAADTNLRVRAVPNLGTRDWGPYSNAPQYDPAKLKEIALPAITQLRKTHGGSLYILLTGRDINSASGNFRFVFSESYPDDKVSVISVARMFLGATGQQASAQLVGERLRKMTLRTIGLMYYGLPRSADPKDLMYSPLMSLEALDGLEPSLGRQPTAPTAAE